MEQTMALRDQLKAGLVAGLTAGILIDLFLFAMQLATGTPPDKLAGNFVFIAAVVLGPGAYTNPIAVPLGIVLHFCVAIGWALGYVYLVRSQPQLVARPWISGAAYGLVVYVFMEIILITAGQYHRVAPGLLFTQMIAHVVFYGIPVAVIASRMLRSVVVNPSTSSG
ncbi:MAG: hypothetical protein M3169_12565 [Candidatus Eremiobacteraeota bacterium]|nr:hypothetical protein [Candidatus Eremiobacteraeota bacterium]